MKLMVAWYAVKDFEASKKFYGETLGLTQTFEMQGWCEFAHAAARKSLEKKGVTFLGETAEIPGAVKLATFTDPSGNRLQLCQSLMG